MGKSFPLPRWVGPGLSEARGWEVRAAAQMRGDGGLSWAAGKDNMDKSKLELQSEGEDSVSVGRLI